MPTLPGRLAHSKSIITGNESLSKREVPKSREEGLRGDRNLEDDAVVSTPTLLIPNDELFDNVDDDEPDEEESTVPPKSTKMLKKKGASAFLWRVVEGLRNHFK